LGIVGSLAAGATLVYLLEPKKKELEDPTLRPIRDVYKNSFKITIYFIFDVILIYLFYFIYLMCNFIFKI